MTLPGSWVVSARNSFKNAHCFSPNQFHFDKDPNFPNFSDDLLPALENKITGEITAKNLSASPS